MHIGNLHARPGVNAETTQAPQRVDRASPLGNPFVLEDANDAAQRDAVCTAYEALLREPLCGRARVEEIGRSHGCIGRIAAWDGSRAIEEMARLSALASAGPN